MRVCYSLVGLIEKLCGQREREKGGENGTLTRSHATQRSITNIWVPHDLVRIVSVRLTRLLQSLINVIDLYAASISMGRNPDTFISG